MNPTNTQSDFNAAHSANVQPHPQGSASVTPNRNASPAPVPGQIQNAERLDNRLSLGIELADFANIVAGVAGLYVARKHCTSLLAGILMACPSQYLTRIIPFLAKFKILTNITVSFLAGVIGCKSPYRFIMGYFLSKAAYICVSCVCKLYSSYVG